MDFNCLLRVGYVVPVSEGLPAIGYHLHEHASQRRVGNMSDARLIGLHVDFELLVLQESVLFDGLYVDACIFHRLFRVATGHYDSDAVFR